MTNELISAIPGLVAGADLTAAKYKVLKLSGPDTVDVATAVGDAIIGILANDPGNGEAAVVAGPGSIVGCLAGGAISVGAWLTVDAQGRAVAAAPAAGVNNRVVGVALSSTAAAGQYVKVFVMPTQIQG